MPVDPAYSMRGSAYHSPMTGRWPARKRCREASVIAATFFAMSVGSSFVPERYGPATRIIRALTHHPPCMVPYGRLWRFEVGQVPWCRVQFTQTWILPDEDRKAPGLPPGFQALRYHWALPAPMPV